MHLIVQVMQQISDHVRHEFNAMSVVYAQPAQTPHPTVPIYTGCPLDVAPLRCQYQSHSGHNQSPVHATNHQAHPVYASDTFTAARLQPQPFGEAHVSAGRPPSMLSHSMYGQQVSPQQAFPSNHSLPPAQHQMLAPAGAAVQHLHAQPTDVSFAPQPAAAPRQLAIQVAVGNSLQHSASELHGVSSRQHSVPVLPQGSSALLHHAALSAAASSPAPAGCTDQPPSITPPQHVAAVGMHVDQADGTAQRAIISQHSGLMQCPNQSMPAACDHLQRQHAAPMSAALCTGTPDPQVLLGTTACGALAHPTNGLAAHTHPQSMSAAMPATQEAPFHSVQHTLLHGQQHNPVQQQQHSSVPLTSDMRQAHSLPPQQQPPVPGRTGPGLHTTWATPPSRAAGLSSLLCAVEEGQPAVTSSATAASAPAAKRNVTGAIPHTSAAAGIGSQAAGSIAVPSTQKPDSRAAPLPAPACSALPTHVVKPSLLPQRIAGPLDCLATPSIPAQQLTSLSVIPGQMAPLDVSAQLRQSPDTCASIGSHSVAALLPVSVGHAGPSAEQVASDGSFKFRAQTDCVQGVSAGVCCTPVLRPRGQEVAHAGMSVTVYSSLAGSVYTQLLCKSCKSWVGM